MPRTHGSFGLKKKRNKDPNASQRARSAHLFFADAQREDVKKERPGIVPGQISEVLTEQWNALSDREKGPYEEMAIKDTKRYEDEQPAARAEGDEDESD